MKDISSISSRHKILFHLKENQESSSKSEKSVNITQKGISDELNISRTHVSRVLKELSNQEMVKEEMASVKNHDRKLKTYSLTTKGTKKVDDLLEELEDIEINLLDGERKDKIPITKIEEKTKGKISIIECIKLLDKTKKEEINLQDPKHIKKTEMTEEVPKVEKFVGREEEIDEIEEWLKSEVPFLMIVGQKGFGSSTLAAKFIETIENRHLKWLNLQEKSKEDIENEIENFLEEIGEKDEDIIEEIVSQRALLIFDDYYDMSDKIVNFFHDLLEQINKNDSLKVIVTGRKGAPVFERFYEEKHKKQGIVRELKVSPLSEKSAEEILEKNLKEDAMERIMMFTKGSPLLLKFLKEGKKKKLNEMTPWEKEQISLLMYLKDQTKD